MKVTPKKVSWTIIMAGSALILLGMICGALNLGLSTFRIGYMNASTLMMRQEINKNWRLGHSSEATIQFIQMLGMSIDGGIRQQLSDQLYVQGVRPLVAQGRSGEAQDFCQISITILGDYDPGGSRQYQCERLPPPSASPHAQPEASP